MSRPHIPKEQLVDRAYYKGHCRNATEARWDAARNCFVHWRTKFNMRYLETIKHPEDEKNYDVFYPQTLLDTGTVHIPVTGD